MLNDPKLWFGPKKLGQGIQPTSWEGWAVTIGFVVVVIGLTQLF